MLALNVMMPTVLETHRRPPGAFATAVRAALAALAAGATLALLSPAPGYAANFIPDQGVYHVYQNNYLLGTERVTFEQRGDSAIVISVVKEHLPHPDGKLDTLSKTSTLIASIRDGGLRDYTSYEVLNGDVLNRTLSMADTTYTSYRQSDTGGFGDTFARPPGRIYVIDPQVFAMFDVLCRDMHAQRFEERPVTLLYITARDSAVDGRVKRLGTGPFKFGRDTLTAEKFSMTDPWSEFLMWTAPDGRMVRLMMPAVGLRVDRDPETFKPHVIETVVPPPTGVPAIVMAPRGPLKAGPPFKPDSLKRSRPRGR